MVKVLILTLYQTILTLLSIKPYFIQDIRSQNNILFLYMTPFPYRVNYSLWIVRILIKGTYN